MTPPGRSMDYASFVEVHRQTAEPLRRYAARVLGSSEAAEDVVQECFARALASVNFPRDAEEARAYLFRVASNLMKDHWRRRRRELAHAPDVADVSSSTDPGAQLDIARLFSHLDLRERQLIWLAHVEGADHAAIGVVLGVGEASVKVMLHRARRKFAELLRGAGYDAEGSNSDVR